MNYKKVYDDFIKDRLSGFSSKAKHIGRERHHIIPKCMNGTNDDANIISLTYSDHIFAHLLLAKIYGRKLAIAFAKMTTVERYKGRHTRLKHAALMNEARLAKGDGRRGTTQTLKQRAAIKIANIKKRGKGMHPNAYAALIPIWASRVGSKAHPNSIAAASRRGSDRTPAQIARNEKIFADRRGKPPHPNSLAAVKVLAEQRRGQPWSPARRAAQETKKLRISTSN